MRDWGTWSYTQRAASYAPSVGVLASISHTWFRYGFRKDPFASRSIARLDVSLGERRPRLTYDGTFRRTNSTRVTNVQLTASGLELIRFHGIGNETSSDSGTSYYRVFQNLFRFEPAWVLRGGEHTTWSLGVVAQYTETRANAKRLRTTRPRECSFGQAGGRLSASSPAKRLRADPRLPTAAGAPLSAIWDVESTFGEAHASASTYLSAKVPLAPTLALRAGANRVWGTFPFHEAAFLGGSSTLRGWDEQRFAGRSAVFGASELRVLLGKVFIIVPADLGVVGFADVGQVAVDGERSDVWHSGVGGGIWIAPITRVHTVSLTVARGRERTAFYVKSGFAF